MKTISAEAFGLAIGKPGQVGTIVMNRPAIQPRQAIGDCLTLEAFASLIEKAREAGRLAAQAKLETLQLQAPNAKAFDVCGGGHLILKADGRSALGKFLNSVGHSLSGVDVRRNLCGPGFSINILGMTRFQDRCLHLVAENVAMQILTSALEVEGEVQPYVD